MKNFVFSLFSVTILLSPFTTPSFAQTPSTTPVPQSFQDLPTLVAGQNTNLPLGALALVKIADLRPTQLSVGMISVRYKEQKYLKKLAKSEQKYEQELIENPVPIVIGNGGQFYILDHHHETRAIYEIQHDTMVVSITQNWSSLNPTDFWQKMAAQNYLYLSDENDVIHPYSDLPKFIQNMSDDPYRSLAGDVEDAGGFSKAPVLYLEFIWAHFFRQQGITSSEITDASDDSVCSPAAIQKGVSLAHTPAASALPGYTPE